jgi:hypothetical protein
MKTNEKAIIIQVDGQARRVDYESYLKKTHKMLQEFGYPNLTLEDVRYHAERILAGEDVSADVIGVIMKDNIATDQSAA